MYDHTWFEFHVELMILWHKNQGNTTNIRKLRSLSTFPKRPVLHQGLAIEHEGPLRVVFHLSAPLYVCWNGSAHVLQIVGLNGRCTDSRGEIASTLCPPENTMTAVPFGVQVEGQFNPYRSLFISASHQANLMWHVDWREQTDTYRCDSTSHWGILAMAVTVISF